MVNDGVLLQRYASEQDAEAFAELARRYAGLVYGTCLRVLGNAADAEDVAQECFLELARKAGSIRSSLPGWLHALARSRAIDARRKDATRRAYEQQAALEPGGHDGEDASWADIAPLVDEALATLPDNLRAPLLLHYLQGKTQAEVAALLGTTQATVSRRIDRGIHDLRDHLRQLGVLGTLAGLTLLLQEHALAAVPPSLGDTLAKMAMSGVAGTATVAAAKGIAAKWSLSKIAAAVALFAGVAIIAVVLVRGRMAAEVAASGAQMPKLKPYVTEAPAKLPVDSYSPKNATLKQGIHLAYQADITIGQLPKPFVDWRLKESNRTLDEYPGMRDRLAGDVRSSGKFEYFGTPTNSIWIDWGKLSAVCYRSTRLYVGDPHSLWPDYYPTAPRVPYPQMSVHVLRDNKGDLDKMPYLGFLQPGNILFSHPGDFFPLDAIVKTAHGTEYRYKEHPKQVVPINHVLITDTHGRVIRYEYRTKTRVRASYTYEEFQTLAPGFHVPRKVTYTENRSWSEGNVPSGKVHRWVDQRAVYRLTNAEVGNFDHGIFTITHPAQGIMVTDDRYDHNSYTYDDRSIAIGEAGKREQQRMRKLTRPAWKDKILSWFL